MRESSPEEELEMAFHGFWNDGDSGLTHDETGEEYYARVPLYVLQETIERLRRYATIVNNLTDVGEFLWQENLRKYGGRKIHKKETPFGSIDDPVFQRMSCLVSPAREPEELTLDDAYVELTLSHCRLATDDPTGLNQYLDKEFELFEQLEQGE